MKAIVFHGIGDIRLDNVREPRLEEDTDAIVRLTASAICGTDLHMIRGTVVEMKPGTILGREGVGIVSARTWLIFMKVPRWPCSVAALWGNSRPQARKCWAPGA
ncbi:MAG TPA: alcohol dehydrogenase catalytic domain-containing protein [Candidatus Acidoferrales bacterium]|nr:alcohol dehydrogenase catalytic domain-containing protein [Candidatus Acidoferrales bacterium]